MKLTDIKVIYICPDHNDKYHMRKLHMDDMLAGFGFRDVTHFKSGTEMYPECLNNAVIAILEAHMDVPILILEDDVECTGIDTIAWDASADAIYLGLSRYGGSRTENRWHGGSQLMPVAEPSQLRVMNMLATHAILYISRSYKQAVIDTLRSHAGQSYNTDVLISRMQPYFRVLATRVPVFYQSNRFNVHDLETATRFAINIHGVPVLMQRVVTIRDIPVVYVCPDHNEKYHDRKVYMDHLLTRLGCAQKTHYKCGTVYPECITESMIHMLRSHIDDEPVLFLEDDVASMGNTEWMLDVTADATYVGLYRYGTKGAAELEPTGDEKLLRVRNMLGSYAIVFQSRRFKEAVLSALLGMRGSCTEPGEILATFQRSYRVFAMSQPLFYQTNTLNSADLEEVTRVAWNSATRQLVAIAPVPSTRPTPATAPRSMPVPGRRFRPPVIKSGVLMRQ